MKFDMIKLTFFSSLSIFVSSVVIGYKMGGIKRGVPWIICQKE